MDTGPPRLFLKNLRPYTTTSQVSNALAEWNVSDGLVHVHCARRRFCSVDEPVTFFCTYTTQQQVLQAVTSLHQQFFLSDKMIIAAVAEPRRQDALYPVQRIQATSQPEGTSAKSGRQPSPPTPAPWNKPTPPPPPPVPKAPVQQDQNKEFDHVLNTLTAALGDHETMEGEKGSQEKLEDVKDDKIGGGDEKDEEKQNGEKSEKIEGISKDVGDREEKENEEKMEVPSLAEDGYGLLVEVKEESDNEESGWNALEALANMPEDESTSDYRDQGGEQPDIDDDTQESEANEDDEKEKSLTAKKKAKLRENDREKEKEKEKKKFRKRRRRSSSRRRRSRSRRRSRGRRRRRSRKRWSSSYTSDS